MSGTPWNSIAEGHVIPTESRLSYTEALTSPCRSCSTVPCCSHLPLQTFKITNIVELDHAIYTLNFDRMVLGVHASGDWSVYYSYPCQFLNRENFTCDIHESPDRPQICLHYSPYRCWYKKAFTGNSDGDFVLIDRQRMEFLLPYIVFDDSRDIIQVPDWATIISIIDNLPQLPRLPANEPSVDDSITTIWKNMALGLDIGHEQRETCSYDDLKDLCNHCQGYCCKTLLFPADIPSSIANLDYLKFCLSFPGVELGIADGAWSLVVRSNCRHLKDGRCTIYQEPERPILCRNYDSWRCNYRIDFGEPRPPGFLRVTLPEFDSLTKCFRFDKNGVVVGMPATEDIRNYIEEGWRKGAAKQEHEPVLVSTV